LKKRISINLKKLLKAYIPKKGDWIFTIFKAFYNKFKSYSWTVNNYNNKNKYPSSTLLVVVGNVDMWTSRFNLLSDSWTKMFNRSRQRLRISVWWNGHQHKTLLGIYMSRFSYFF
jgi:hypothetical protein